jgi:hypothetical protein
MIRDEDYKAYGPHECAFSVERKGSFKVVVLLLLVLCLPLLCVLSRRTGDRLPLRWWRLP